MRSAIAPIDRAADAPGDRRNAADALARLKWSLAASPVLLLLASAASGAEPVTAANWRRHPAIVEIEAIYREVRQAEAAGCLRRKARHNMMRSDNLPGEEVS